MPAIPSIRQSGQIANAVQLESRVVQREYVEWLAEQLNVNLVDDWYKVKHSDVLDPKGGRLLTLYQGSTAALLNSVFPDTQWHPWRFAILSPEYFQSQLHQREYFEWLADQLQIEDWKDWAFVRIHDVLKLHGNWILAQNQSLEAALKNVYPNTAWESLEWKFGTQFNNSRAYFDWLAEILSIESIDDWYNLSAADLEENEGEKILHSHGGSAYKALVASYAHTNWLPWRFAAMPQGFWCELANQRAYVEWLGDCLEFSTLNDFYKLKHTDFANTCGGGLLHRYNGSPQKLLRTVFPEVEWHAWLFAYVGAGYWDKLENQRDFLDWVAARHRVHSVDDWHIVDKKVLVEYGGAGLLKLYRGSLDAALEAVYKDAEWQPWLLGNTATDFFASSENRRKCMDWLAEQMRVSYVDDWYSVKQADVLKRKCGGLVSYYGSFIRALEGVYIHTTWQPWRFANAPQGFWNQVENQRKFLDWFAEENNVRGVDDWYRVSESQMEGQGGLPLLNIYGNSILKALTSVYPDANWQPWLRDFPDQLWENIGNQKKFTDWFEAVSGITEKEGWYNVTLGEIWKKGGQSLMNIHGNQLHVLLDTVYPEVEWLPWLFEHQDDIWEEHWFQEKYFEWLSIQLGIKRQDDWYEVKRADFNRGGDGLLRRYDHLVANVLVSVYWELYWDYWKFAHPRDFWFKLKNQRAFFDYLAEELLIHDVNHWYDLQVDQVGNKGGQFLLNHYGALYKALQSIYPFTQWQLWKFASIPSTFWDVLENQQAYFNWLSEECNVNKLEDWYQLKHGQIMAKDKLNLIYRLYEGSPFKALTTVFPDAGWHRWLFHDVPTSFWKKKENQLNFLEWLKDQLKITKNEQWYEVNKTAIILKGGTGLLMHYNHSLLNMLISLIPEEEWLPWKFTPLPRGFWEKRENLFQYMRWLEKQFEIKDPDDWYGISGAQMIAYDGASLLQQTGGLANLLKQYYPDNDWTEDKWKMSSSKAQQFLYRAIHTLFPGCEILYNHHLHYLKYSDSGKPMELDVWIPNYNLALEYQGKQHYTPSNIMGEYQWLIHKDTQKKTACKESEIAYVQVPYWWDFRDSSLAATILPHCPDFNYHGISKGIEIGRSMAGYHHRDAVFLSIESEETDEQWQLTQLH